MGKPWSKETWLEARQRKKKGKETMKKREAERAEDARRAREEARKFEEFAKIQEQKGLILAFGSWVTPDERDRLIKEEEKEIEKQLKEMEEKKTEEKKARYASYAGQTMECSSCNYVWAIKKQIGLPGKCPRCGDISIRLVEDYNA